MDDSSLVEGHIPDAILKVERAAVPACGFADCTRAVRKLARPATTPVCQELAARGADRLSATMKRGTGLSRGREVFGECRDGAPKGERARTADDRGNANRPWRAPHRSAGSDALIRSAGAEVDYAPLGAPPPFIIWRQLACSGLA
jgi:hypothetical protein